jgi:hypothetical protein
MLFLSLLLPIAFSLLFIQLIWPSHKVFDCHMAINLFLSIGLGLGISSLSYWFFLVIYGSYNSFSIMIEIIILIALIAACAIILLRSGHKNFENEQCCLNRIENEDILTWKKIPLITTGFWMAITCSMLLFIIRTVTHPHGSWDAWAIWNMRARFLYRCKDHWIYAFSRIYPHSDYPLLIPANISRVWNYIGSDNIYTPAIVAFLFTFSTIGLVVSSMIFIKNRNHGYLTGLVLLSIYFFTIQGAGQIADVPFGFFVLSTVVLFFINEKSPEKSFGFYFLAGIMAGLSAWTKNEGLLFVLVILLSHFVVTVFQKGWISYFKEITPLLAGLLPLLLITLHFKMRLTVSNDLVSERNFDSIINLLLDHKRYFLVSKIYLYYLIKNFLIIIIVFPIMFIVLKLSSDKNYKTNSTICFLAIFLLLSGYFMIYIISPHNLEWHLKTSMSRLYLQVMPSIIFVFLTLLNTIEGKN